MWPARIRLMKAWFGKECIRLFRPNRMFRVLSLPRTSPSILGLNRGKSRRLPLTTCIPWFSPRKDPVTLKLV